MTPENWKRVSVGDICEFTSGTGFGEKDWAKDGLPIIRIQNLNGSRLFNYFAGQPEAKWIVNRGDLLFAWAGVPGVSFGPTIWDGPQGVLNQHIYRITPARDIDKGWLFAALQIVTSSIEKSAHGFKSSLLHVHKSDITEHSIGLPPIPEQKAIAAVLSTWDRAIAQTSTLIAAKERLKSGLMQQLLTGKRRFKGFKEEWKETSFGSFMTESRVPGCNGAEAKKLTVKLYGKGVIPKQETRMGSEATRYFRRRAGQFIYSKLDFLNGAFGIVPMSLDGYESTLDVPAFDVADSVDPRWLIAFVSRATFYRDQLGLANGGRKARRVNPDDFAKIAVPFPAKSEQSHVANAIDVFNREVTLLQDYVARLKAQKRGLMQQLLTGKVRVSGKLLKQGAGT